MIITKLHSKLHNLTVTSANLNYEGSIALDRDFLIKTGMEPFEKVDIYNISNGARFSTYIIEAPNGSKEVSLNGAAARLVQAGDRIIVCCFRGYETSEYKNPKIVLFGENNKIISPT